MGNYEELKSAIADVIKQNGRNEITGDLLQNVLLTMVNALGLGATFRGMATPDTIPGIPDERVFYFANVAGTYAGFGNKVVPAGLSVIAGDGSGWEVTKLAGGDDDVYAKVEALSGLLVESGNKYEYSPEKTGQVCYYSSAGVLSASPGIGRLVPLLTGADMTQTYWWKSFVDDDVISGWGVRSMHNLCSDTPLAIGDTAIRFGSSAPQFARGYGQPLARYTYIYIEFQDASYNTDETILEFIKNLSCVYGTDYPDAYEEPLKLEVTAAALSPGLRLEIAGNVKEYQGVGNAGKVLRVNSAGRVYPATPEGGEGGGSADLSLCARRENTKTLYLGANLLEGVAGSGAGWEHSNGVYHHATGYDSPLTFPFETTVGKAYVAAFRANTLSGYSEESVMVSIGDGGRCDTYNGTMAMRYIGMLSSGGNLQFYEPKDTSVDIIDVGLYELVGEENAVSAIEVQMDNMDAGLMRSNITGWWNVALGGASVMGQNQNGSRNIAVGEHSLELLEHGERNVGIGTYALQSLKNGIRNIAVGADALYKVFAAKFNVAIGKAALGWTFAESDRGNHVVEGNTAVGDNAMGNDGKDFLYNTAVGKDAGSGVFDRTNSRMYNVAVGAYSGYYELEYNVSVGYMAGRYVKGDNNVHIGANAGDIETTGSDNVIIGANARANDGNGTWSAQSEIDNTIVIGANAKGTKSNQVVIGNALQTEMVVLGNKLLKFNSDGSVTWSQL